MGNGLGLTMFGEKFCLLGVGIEGVEGEIELQRAVSRGHGAVVGS